MVIPICKHTERNKMPILTLRELHNACVQANKKHSDICESIPIFIGLGLGAQSIAEFGQGPPQYGLNSTMGLFYGLARSEKEDKKFYCYDLTYNPGLDNVGDTAVDLDIEYEYFKEDTGEVIIPPVDVLFIDSEHTYQHMMRELANNKDLVSTYVALHDTSGKYSTWEDWPFDHERRGELAKYPEKYGMWPAVQDFVLENPEWEIAYRHTVGNGLTVLKRVSATGWVDFDMYNERVALTDQSF